MSKVFWVNKNGEEIEITGINSHIGLAQHFLEKSRVLKAQYENRKDKGQNIIDFFISDMGWMKGSQLSSYKNITFDSRKLSDKQRDVLIAYYEEDYTYYCFFSCSISYTC